MNFIEETSLYSSEDAVLGTLLVNSYEAFNYIKDLKYYMFDKDANRAIFNAMVEGVTAGIEPNLSFVYHKLRDNEQLNRAGGQGYLTALQDVHQPVRNLSDMVMRVQNLYKVRRLKEINAGIPELLANESKVNEVISKLHIALDNMIQEIGTPDVSKLADSMDETFAKLLERRKNPGIRGYSTGIQEIDHMTTGLNPGELWFIGARPSHGKSAWLIKTAMQVANGGNAVMIFNREMNRDDINERIISIISGIDLLRIRLGEVKDEEIPFIERATKIAKDLPIYVDNNFTSGIDYIVATIRKYRQLYDIKVVGIDYIQLIVERSAESTHLLGAASRQLKLLANELGMTVIILSQLNRNVEQREEKRPLMSDLRQSGNLEEDADIMVGLYRDELYVNGSPDEGKLEFIIRKSRNGPTGTIRLNFHKETVNITHNKLDSWGDRSFV